MVMCAVQDFRFISPVSLGDILRFQYELVNVGHTSLTIAVEARDMLNPETLFASCQVVFVNTDEQGKSAPTALPFLLCNLLYRNIICIPFSSSQPCWVRNLYPRELTLLLHFPQARPFPPTAGTIPVKTVLLPGQSAPGRRPPFDHLNNTPHFPPSLPFLPALPGFQEDF